MARKKQIRFAENIERYNIFEPEKPAYTTIRGRWQGDFFQNENPVVLELGCGKGEYTTGLAKIFPEKNFIGTDAKGDRLWAGSTEALENGLENVAFLRTDIRHLGNFFAPGEVNEIWLPFPDPQPKDRNEKNRLTSPGFLKIYQNLLGNNTPGHVHLKTDSEMLFRYTLGILGVEGFPRITQLFLPVPPVEDLKFTFDLYRSDLQAFHHNIKTRFERSFLAEGLPVCYLQFRFGI
jgi:tRNA (guanine-N7-)-methyltransferase